MGESPGFLGPRMEEGGQGLDGLLFGYLASLRRNSATLLAPTDGPLPKFPSGGVLSFSLDSLSSRHVVLPLASPGVKVPASPPSCLSRRNAIAIYARYSTRSIGGEKVQTAVHSAIRRPFSKA